MSLSKYPTLQKIHEELAAVDAAGEVPPPGKRQRYRVSDGRGLSRVEWPGCGRYWVTAPQKAVVLVLLDAYLHSRSPEVPQEALIRASGVEGIRRLGELFGRNPILGEVIVSGKQAGTYRLVEVPELTAGDEKEQGE